MKTEDKEPSSEHFIDGHWWTIKYNKEKERLEISHDASSCSTCKANLAKKKIIVQTVLLPPRPENGMIYDSEASW